MPRKSDRNANDPPDERVTYHEHTLHEAEDLRLFERAIALFNAGRFAEAKQIFEQLTKSSDRGLAHVALLRKRMCDQRI